MDLDAALARLAQDEAVPLDPAEIALWLARDEYAGLDVEAYLSELNAMAREAKNYMAGTPLRLILVRMLSKLKAIYLQRADFERAARAIGRQCQLCPHDFVQRRDLGLTLVHAGRWGQAIDHLSTYLAAMPQANDFEQV